jgi:isocitrate dehydrogenase
MILSGAMMFRHIRWIEAADAVEGALRQTVGERIVTYDLARQLPGSREVSCSGFAEAVASRIAGPSSP